VHLQLSSSLASFASAHSQTSLVPTQVSSGGWFVRAPSALTRSILISFVRILFNDAVSNSVFAVSRHWMTVSDEWEGMWKEATVS
jgi:hypothetical protein